MKPASTALATGERLAAWLAPPEWEPFAGPILRTESAEAAAASLNMNDRWHEYRVFARGCGWIVKRRAK